MINSIPPLSVSQFKQSEQSISRQEGRFSGEQFGEGRFARPAHHDDSNRPDPAGQPLPFGARLRALRDDFPAF
jgi:hypothetical protein